MQGKYIILYIPLVFDHQYLVDRDEIRRSVLLNIQHEPHGIPWKNLCAQFSFDKHVCALEYPLMPSAPNIALAPTGRGQDTELYYIYLEIGLLYFRQSKKCGQKHGGR